MNLAGRLCLPLALAASAAACGAKSGLEAPVFDPGAGGVAGAGGSGGGGGGQPVVCAGLVLDGPPIRALDPLDADSHEESPTALVSGPSRVVVPFRVANAGLSAVLRAPTFEAWGAWPADMGSAFDVVGWDFPQYVASKGRGDDDLTVLHGSPALGGNEGDAFADLTPAIEPATSYPAGAPNQFLSTLAPGRPAAVSGGPTGFHVSWQISSGNDLFFLQQTEVEPPGQEAFPHWESGCATSRMRAAALALPDSHLSAFSTGRQWFHCGLDDGVIGPPTRVQVERWADDAAALGFEWEGDGEPIANLALVARPGGAWVVFQTDGSTSETVPGVVAVPLDTDGAAAGDWVTLVTDGQVFGPLAAASLGDGFVVAWVDAVDPSAPTVRVRAFDVAGALRAEGSLGTADAFLVGGRVSVAGSPAGDAVVLAWASLDPEGTRVVAARLSCF